jgi:hypothetical protein
MRSHSDDRPEEVWIRYIDRQGIAHIRLRREVKETDVLDVNTGKSRKTFDYEETETELVSRPGLADYARENLEALFVRGLEAEGQEPALSDHEEIVKVKSSLKQLADVLVSKGVITVEEKDQIDPKTTGGKG